VAAIQHFAGKLPILGVCLGHQSIGAAFGGKIIRAQELMHGKTSVITTTQQGVFAGLPRQFTVNRYHSLAIERASCPRCWKSPPGRRTARSWACATRAAHGGRAVPPREHPDRAWPRHAEELPGAARLIDAQQLLLFIAAGWLLNLTPGPDVLYIVTRALKNGLRAGLVAGLGIAAGCLVHVGAAAVGVGALLAASSTAFTLLKWLGAAYLLWLGLRLRRAATVRWPAWCARRPVTRRRRSRSRRFPGRLLDQCAQSQGGHLLPGLRAAVHRPRRRQQGAGLCAAGVLFTVNAILVNALWALAAAWLVRRVGAVQRGMHWLDRVAGLLFIGLACAWR
jgi:threonine/homoserine/homoserine lactone efflux protein